MRFLLLGRFPARFSGLGFYFLISASLFAGQVTVSWTDNSTNETGFKVERSPDGVTFTPLATVGANVTSYVDNDLVAATKYWYRVCAFNATTSSPYSNITSLTTPALSSTASAPLVQVPSRLVHVSARAIAGPWGSAAVRLMFEVVNNPKPVLLRGIGPGLAPYTTAVTLANPKLSLYDGPTLIGSNDNWGGSATLSSLFTEIGAFSLPATSVDAAILSSLVAGNYTADITGKKGGMAMAEIYDADTSGSSPGRLAKVIVRAPVSTGEGVLVAGFAVSGDTALHLLVRAIGPSQSGLPGLLKDPQLEIYQGSTLLAHNDNWGGSSTLSALFAKVGASNLSAQSKDAAIDVSLTAGTYIAVISGVNGTSGIGRLEFYVAP